ncbi:hypothetical protein HanIR_Chr14g0684661 [Helianthus annuus]|nr:hypothetical protein HanIR_Chr14g0684661 [Helianthus annuus]
MFDLIFRIWIIPNPDPDPNLLRICERFETTVGAETVCSEMVCKVEEEKCRCVNAVHGVAIVYCNVSGNGNCNGNDDSAYVFVNLSVQVSAGEFGDAGGVNVEQFKNEGVTVDPLMSETNGVVHGAMPVSVTEVVW